jgi:hypothetical protein
MMKYDRLPDGPVVFAIDQRPLASCAVRPSSFRTKREGESGKAAAHDYPRGFGVFVNTRFTN